MIGIPFQRRVRYICAGSFLMLSLSCAGPGRNSITPPAQADRSDSASFSVKNPALKEIQSGDTTTGRSAGRTQNAFRDTSHIDTTAFAKLSRATRLLLKAADNYIEVLPQSNRAPEVLMLKGHMFYNAKLFEPARSAYKAVVEKYAKSLEVPEAIKMTAQTFYEEKKFDDAKVWYTKLKDVAVSGEDKAEAGVRLAESYYRIAEKYRESGQTDLAINMFEKIQIEYPDSRLADAALFNMGLLYGDKKVWTNAILTFNKLIAQYPASSQIEPALFHTASCYEQSGNFSKAALTYVEIFKRFPNSPKVKEALYNAGLDYEKDENKEMAAAIFEKYATVFPGEKDAPDVLFRAGELYGKLENWAKVEEITSQFGIRYGSDRNRIVMVLCMTGSASYMQKKYDRALVEFEKAIRTGKEIGLDNQANAYYAAKAQYTIGQINQERAQAIELLLPEAEYKRRLKDRIALTDAAVSAFTKVSSFKLIEWTTQAIYRIGETYEQFGVAMYKRERPMNSSFDKMVALEEGIAKVVEDYLVDRALSTHEENVKFGIKYQVEDEWIKRSRQQLTKLPFLAAENYTKLVEIVTVSSDKRAASDPMKIIQEKLESLQNIAPFQDKAIKLHLKTLEVAAKYGIKDKFTAQAASEITKISYQVGATYAEVVAVARGAPIPATYDSYQKFFYKVTLLSEGIVEYENNAIQALFKNIKIAEAYEIKDEWVQKSKEKITEILFTRSLCYEILAWEAFKRPPIPTGADADEAEEYRLQLEDLGYKLQDEAFSIYRDILAKNKQGVTSGPYADLAYIRLFKNFPNEVGERVQRDTLMTVVSGKDWVFADSASGGWERPDFEDAAWQPVKKGVKPDSVEVMGFSEKTSSVWGGAVKDGKIVYSNQVFFRRVFNAREKPLSAVVEFAATGSYDIFVNGMPVKSDSTERTRAWFRSRRHPEVANYFTKGRNVIAARVKNTQANAFGFYLYCTYTDKIEEIRAKLPMQQKILSAEELKAVNLSYPAIPNFEYDEAIFKGKG